MNLKLNNWTKKDIINFENYLKSFSHPEKSNWERKIVNTNLPCIFVESKNINYIVKEILKGNYLSFLSFFLHNNHSETIILSKLISKIKDEETLIFYLNKLSNICDNWATCDAIKIKVTNKNKDQIFKIACKFIESSNTFSRRIGFKMLFEYINKSYIESIFTIIRNSFKEQEYYVNMIISWLLCECFIKEREKTINFLKSNNLNKFVLNKFISKCNDSFRIDKKDKIYLKTLKL